MKYPQLVPVRAVSAISEWLVHKLEQLGVDEPLVYSRLLLSLLHTPLQVNALDLAELSHLRGWSGKRKGRRISPSDAEALRRFAAIESLNEVASSDEKESQIEDLITELCEKLREIEKQTKIDNENEFSKQPTSATTKKSSNTNMSEDPRKLYYNAFPALSKKFATDMKSTATSAVPSSSSRPSTCLIWPSGASTSKATTITKVLTKMNNNTNSIDTAGVKRRQRRRRNKYGNGKGKQTYTKKNSMAKSNNSNTINNSSNNSNSMSLWDTNFEGSWEMGHDLIKDFIVKQNNRNRSISESDASKIIEYSDILTSATDKIMKRNSIDCVNNKFKQTTNKEGTMILRNMLRLTNNKDYYNNGYENEGVGTNGLLFSPGGSSSTTTTTTTTDTSVLLFGSIPMRDEGYATPDTLTSMSEYDNLNNINTLPRRLYEREVSNDSICIPDNKINDSNDESHHLALFEAKFNSSVEALWNDGKDDNMANEATATNENQNGKGQPFDYNLFKLQTTINSFWFNYYKHHYNNTRNEDHESAIHAADNNGIFRSIESVKDPITEAIASGMDVYHYQSSIPTNSLPFRNDSPNSKTHQENKTRKNDFIQLGTNLISSIWSNNNGLAANVSNEEDTSFYVSKGFWEKNSLQNNTDQQYMTGSGLSQSLGYQVNNVANTNFLKWSDCSFEAPFVPSSTNTDENNFKSTKEPQRADCYDFKSLPAISSSIHKTQYNKRSVETVACELTSLQTGYELLFNNNINPEADNKNKNDAGSSGVGSLANSSVSSSIFNEQRNLNLNIATASAVACKRHITLLNHSKTSSFAEVIPSSVTGSKNNVTRFCDIERVYKSEVGLNMFRNDQQYLRSSSNTNNNQQSQPPPPQEEDNLLTSDQTHFRPIRQSYADGYTFDISNSLEDVEFIRSESGSIYFESDKYMQYIPENYDCGDDIGQPHKINHNSGEGDSPFILKFCVKQIEKGCQTDSDEISKSNNNDEIISNNNFENETNKISKGRVTNKKMNYFALPETIISSNNSDIDDIYMLNNDNYNKIIDNNEEHSCDLDIESWSIDGIKKKCLNNNTNSHTLWGHCATCNNQMNSLPANRLLKDELSADGEEIMSDLRYMQNLYIGSDWEGDDDDPNDDLILEVNEKQNNNNPDIIKKDIANINNNDVPIEACYDVKRLISHLLKPETAKSITQALGENQGHNIIKEIVFKDNTKTQIIGTDELEKEKPAHKNDKKLTTDSNIFWLKNIKQYDDEKSKEICRNLWGESTLGLSNNALNNNCWTNDNNNNTDIADGFWTMLDNNITANTKSNENLIKAISESDCIWSYGNSDNNHCTLGGSNKNILINDLNKKWEYSNLESIWKSEQQQYLNSDNYEMVTNDNLAALSTANEQLISDNIQSINDNNSPASSSRSLLNYYKNDPTYKLSWDKLRQIMDEKQRKLKNCNTLSVITSATTPAALSSDGATVPAATITIKTRYDRKRRHSASQNYNNNITKCIISNCNYSCCQKMKASSFKNNINININNNINNYNICYGEVGSSDGDNNNNINHYKNNNNIDDGGDLFYDTTIITCKYWATADTSFTNKKYEGTMTMNPSSILKHVQMVSRPLTR